MTSLDDIMDAIGWFADVVVFGGAVVYVATKWVEAQRRRDRVADDCAGRALGRVVELQGRLEGRTKLTGNLTIQVPTGKLTFQGHPPTVIAGA